MKRFLAIFVCLLLMLSFSACMCISIPKELLETSETKKTPKATERTVEITQEPNNEINGFDEKTNRVYQVGAYSFQIPAYYYEREQTETLLKFGTAKVDADAIIIVFCNSMDITQEEYIAGIDTVSTKFINIISNAHISTEDDINISGLSGKIIKGKGSTDGIPTSFIITHVFDPHLKKLVVVVFNQKQDSPFDYTSDAEKIIRSIEVDPSVTAAPMATPTQKPTQKPTPKPTPTQKPTPKQGSISYEAFCKIQMGSSLDDVNKILGKEGTLFSSYEVMGIKEEIYNWQGNNFSTISVSLSNGKVSTKSQSGLNKETKAVTLAQYSQITSGMTYDQVKEIMGGDGYISSESSIMGVTTTTYEWNGNGWLSNASISFTNGKVSSMYQYGLS